MVDEKVQVDENYAKDAKVLRTAKKDPVPPDNPSVQDKEKKNYDNANFLDENELKHKLKELEAKEIEAKAREKVKFKS